MSSNQTRKTVLQQMRAIEKSSMPKLRKKWEQLYEEPCPKAPRAQVEAWLKYRVQELAFGGVKPEVREKLHTVAQEVLATAQEKKKCVLPVPGTLIKRVYKRELYEVLILEDGFECRGVKYASLSALASKITGCKRNGWEFFGLKR